MNKYPIAFKPIKKEDTDRQVYILSPSRMLVYWFNADTRLRFINENTEKWVITFSFFYYQQLESQDLWGILPEELALII